MPGFSNRPRCLPALGGTALIVLVTAIAYLPALRGGFLIDDDALLTDSSPIKAADGIYRFWCTTEPVDYWPVSNTSLWIEWRLWGNDPIGYHVTNVVLHIVDACLIWMLLWRLAIPGALLAALLFAVHPVNVESVAWIAQRKNLLALFFMLLCTLSYCATAARASQPAARRWYGIALAAFILALLSKVSAAMLPLLFVGLLWWTRRLERRELAGLAPFFLVAVAMVCVNLWFRGSGSGILAPAGGPTERLLGAAALVWFELGKALVPINLAFIYPRWQIASDQVRWWLPLLAASALTAVLWWCRRSRRGRAALFGWGFYCAALLPAMGFTERLVVADHYQHVALIGLVALAGAAWAEWQRSTRGAQRYLANGAAIAVVGVFALLSSRQSRLYRDNVTLFQDAVDKHLDAASAHRNLAYVLLKEGRLSAAGAHLQEALRLDPEYPEAHIDFGITLAQIGNLQDGIAQLQEAVRLRPDDAAAHNALGMILREAGRPQEAIDHLERALTLQPTLAAAYRHLGKTLLETGRFDEAIAAYRQALRLKPDDADAQHGLNEALAARREPERP